MSRALRRFVRALGLAALLFVACAVWWWTHPPDALRTLHVRMSPVAVVERSATPELGAGVERWRVIDARGDTTFAIWRRASGSAAKPWTVVLLGGLHTGDRAALVVPPETPANVLAVDWPWRESRNLSAWQIAVRLPRVQEAVLRSPAALASAVEAAAMQLDVDSSRVALVGVSLGAPPAMAALPLTQRPRALVLIDGSAGLEGMLRAELERAVRPRVLAAPIAALGFRLGRPLEPALHAEAAANLPTLLVNASRDQLMPRAGVEALRAALPRATVVERPGHHVRVEDRQAIAEMSGFIAAWLDSVAASR